MITDTTVLQEKLKNHTLILGSGSPRRKHFLNELGLEFEVRLKSVEENYPKDLKRAEISDYLALLKAKPFLDELQPTEILITADTIVWFEDQALGKPNSEKQAYEMLRTLSSHEHEVFSSVAISSTTKQVLVNESTKVKFSHLTDEEINYYISKFKPFDKAGSYGIQEWIGLIGVEKIEGSFFNVMGFPIHLFYKEILRF